MATTPRAHLAIAHLMAVVGVTAVGRAALSHPTRLASDVMLDLAVAVTVASAIVTVFARGRYRTFWTGYLIASASYLTLQLIPTYPSGPNSDGGHLYRPTTIWLLDAAFDAVPKPTLNSTETRAPDGSTVLTRVVQRTSGEQVTVVGRDTEVTPNEQAILDEYNHRIDRSGYRRLGYAVFAFLAGIAGGILACVVAPRARESAPTADQAAPALSL